MKFLCVCQGGNNRSAALARILHDDHGQEAVPVGHLRLSEGSLSYFCEWADYVVAMTSEIATHIPARFVGKVRVVDVGEDVYGNPYHSQLSTWLCDVVADWKERGYKL